MEEQKKHEHKSSHIKLVNNTSFWMIVLLALNLIVSIIGLVQKDSAYEIEEMKAGGSENFAMIKEFYESDSYKAQQKAAIQNALNSLNGQQAANPTQDDSANAGDDQATVNSIDKAKVDAIKKDGYIEGNANARFTILEYSEFLCPYCKRQNDEKNLDKVLEKYPNDVNVIFRHFIVHGDPAKKVAEATECAGELGGKDAFVSFANQAFDLSDQSETGLIGLAKTLKLNEAKFTECLKSGKFSAKIDASSNEGRSLFGVSGTPGNVIIDNQNGTFVLVAGAYPFEKFDEEITKMLNAK